jgi:hypothetical protein
LLVAHRTGRSRGGGKLNDLAVHDRTAFPASVAIKASIAVAMVARSW